MHISKICIIREGDQLCCMHRSQVSRADDSHTHFDVDLTYYLRSRPGCACLNVPEPAPAARCRPLAAVSARRHALPKYSMLCQPLPLFPRSLCVLVSLRPACLLKEFGAGNRHVHRYMLRRAYERPRTKLRTHIACTHLCDAAKCMSDSIFAAYVCHIRVSVLVRLWA